MIDHEPRADVNHNETTVQAPQKILIPISVDLANRYDLDVPRSLELDSPLGIMEIDEQGRIFYNGEDITGDIKDKCENDGTEFKKIIEQQTSYSDNADEGRKLP